MYVLGDMEQINFMFQIKYYKSKGKFNNTPFKILNDVYSVYG